jgi:hypothetical protein
MGTSAAGAVAVYTPGTLGAAASLKAKYLPKACRL